MKRLLTATAAALAFATSAFAQDIAIVTPFLAQPGAQALIEGFETRAAEKGWTVNTVDTAGDVAAVISRMEDAVTQNVDAIVIHIDPLQVTPGPASGSGCGHPGNRAWGRQRPAFGDQCDHQRLCDGGRNRGLCGGPDRRHRQRGDVRL